MLSFFLCNCELNNASKKFIRRLRPHRRQYPVAPLKNHGDLKSFVRRLPMDNFVDINVTFDNVNTRHPTPVAHAHRCGKQTTRIDE